MPVAGSHDAAATQTGVETILGLLPTVLTHVRSLALFRLRDEKLTLVASRLLDGEALLRAAEVYTAHLDEVRRGGVAYVRVHASEVAPGGRRAAQAVLLAPALWGEPSRLVGLIYMDSSETDPWPTHALDRLKHWGRLVGKVLAEDVASPVLTPRPAERPPSADRPTTPTPIGVPTSREDAILYGAILYGFRRHGWRPRVVARWLHVTPTTLGRSCHRLGITRDSFERDEIVQALAQYRGNLMRTCAALRMSRSRLLERMAQFGLSLRWRHRPTPESADAEQALRDATLRALNEHAWKLKPTADALGISVSALWARRARFGLRRMRRTLHTGKPRC